MQRLPLNTAIIGILAKEGKPLKLAEIYKKTKDHKISKPTVYRHLQSLVGEGLVSNHEETYVLAQGGDAGVLAADLARINELKPVLSEFQKGFKFTIYSSLAEPLNLESDAVKSDITKLFSRYLVDIDSDLKGVLKNKPLTEDTLKKLIGLKIVLVASFDGTDFSAFTSKETKILPKKRKEILSILAKNNGITMQELGEMLDLNIVQVRQVVDPILASGFAEMDESGKIKLLVELR